MFKAGTIRQIIVKDFVTYNYVELTPGPNLNMIIGPNGTGKSTIVAAIILGLGGNPKTVGRGSKISEYIRHNCNEATIQIFLQDHRKNGRIQITRQFDLNEKSAWTLNDNKVSLKEIENVIKQFNIQVDNLCQFLPQDRVQEFARLNKQQLLLQTQKALCRNDLIEKHLQLIQMREEHKESLINVEQYTQKLQELRDANVRIEGKVKNLTRKKKYLERLEDVDRKVAWTKYEIVRSKLDEIKEDKVKATNNLNTHKGAAEPIQNTITNKKRDITNIEQKITKLTQTLRNHESSVLKSQENYVELKSSVNRVLGDMNSRIREIESKNHEIAGTSREIARIAENRGNIIEKYGDDVKREEKIRLLNENVRKVTSDNNKLMERRGELENIKQNKMYEMRCLENELKKLEDVKRLKLEWLRRMDKDAYTAVQWLRENKQMFTGEVFEPMLLEINVLNIKHAIYIENIIPVRDRIAFTCILKEDMNLFIRMLRDQQKLSVNVVHSGSLPSHMRCYQPYIPIEQLKEYGMFAYIKSLITAPEPIMNYLCKTYQIHNVPVGSTITNEKFENVPPQITNFFSDKFRFSSTYSKYTGQKSTRQNEIISDSSFSMSVNTEHIENIRGQFSHIQGICRKYDEQINDLTNQITHLNQSQSGIRQNLQELRNCKQDILGLESRARVLNNKLEQLQQNNITVQQVKDEAGAQIQLIIKKMVESQSKIKEAFKVYSNLLNELKFNKLKVEKIQTQITALSNKVMDLLLLCERAEETLKMVLATYKTTTIEGKAALSKAKQLSKGFTPPEEGFKEFKQAYDNLPNGLEELEAEKEHINSKIDCLHTADTTELDQYQQRQRSISKLEDGIQEAHVKIDYTNSHMDKLQNEWLNPLQELIQEINVKFGASFKRMGCAGEISVSTGENDKDFSEYGLSIKVKYRDSEPLQELNSTVQSGGEKVVATATYMLSLQELTPVPFRCVDEINQGMDSNNERRIFDLLVDTTSEPDTSQYFFITPKLIPNLKFVRTMTIHIVHNGPYVPPQKKWNHILSCTKQAILDK